MIATLRLILAETLLSWAISVAPPGKERNMICVLVLAYIKFTIRGNDAVQPEK